MVDGFPALLAHAILVHHNDICLFLRLSKVKIFPNAYPNKESHSWRSLVSPNSLPSKRRAHRRAKHMIQRYNLCSFTRRLMVRSMFTGMPLHENIVNHNS
jgi:hypothetical protein